jgi:transposase
MMGKARYVVNLTKDEVEYLEGLVSKGKRSARLITRARVLLKTAAGGKDREIVDALGVSERMVYTTRKACVEGGVDAALHDRPRPGKKPKQTDPQNAHLIATACSEAPAGHARWTLRLLTEQVVQWGFADSFSHESVRQLLKKHPQTLASSGGVHSRSQGGLCGGDGRRSGRGRGTVRSEKAGRLF